MRWFMNRMICMDCRGMFFLNRLIDWCLPGSFSCLTTWYTNRMVLFFFAQLITSISNNSCSIWLSFNLEWDWSLSANLIHVFFIIQILKICHIWIRVFHILNSVDLRLSFALSCMNFINWDASWVIFRDSSKISGQLVHANLMSSLKLILNSIILIPTAFATHLELGLVRYVTERSLWLVCDLIQWFLAGQVMTERSRWLTIHKSIVFWSLWTM